MTVAILSLLGALVPFGIWLWKRRAATQADPAEKNREDYAQSDQPTVRPSVALSDALDELERVERLSQRKDRQQ